MSCGHFKVGTGVDARYHVQATGYPKHDLPEDQWQNLAHGNNRDGIIHMAAAFLECPGCNNVRVYDSQDEVVISLED